MTDIEDERLAADKEYMRLWAKGFAFPESIQARSMFINGWLARARFDGGHSEEFSKALDDARMLGTGWIRITNDGFEQIDHRSIYIASPNPPKEDGE